MYQIYKLFSIRGLNAKIKEHKELVAQLQREKDVPRIKVSEAVADIQKVNNILLRISSIVQNNT